MIKYVFICANCGHTHEGDMRELPSICEKCKKPMVKLVCGRCGHNWYMRKDELPRTCAKCKSPYWNRERER